VPGTVQGEGQELYGPVNQKLHDCVLQAWEVTGLGPASEQNESATVLFEIVSRHTTVRACVPPPHVTEQVLKEPLCHA
jgi:hypothetical protein